MKRRSLYFCGPGRVEVRQEPLAEPGPGEVRVKVLASAISPGTEMLFYRGQVPGDLAVDESFAGMDRPLAYPLKYGYCSVGEVTAAGSEDFAGWLGRRVFAFHPHESDFVSRPEDLYAIPDGVAVEDAVFLPNMETAANLVMDGAPLLGEQALVCGQGAVGLLVTALLARFPLAALVSLERYPLRREASLLLGANASLDPGEAGAAAKAMARLNRGGDYPGADLAFELSGAPEALDLAIALTGYAGRVVIGSWYGLKRAPIDLGGRFHRSRIRLVSSQVSTIAPELSGRWSKARRFAAAWDLIRQVGPSRLITHRFPLDQAAEAYRLLDQSPGEAIQVIFIGDTL